jgi:hypothetical protein
MTLLDRITGRQRGIDPDQTTEERLTEQENLNQQDRDNLPGYPHANEPQETVPEHHVERVMGHEVKPANPYDKFGRMTRREMPAHAMSCTVPTCTNAGRMLNKPAPRSMVSALPKAPAPKRSQPDPFAGLAGSSFKKKKAPLPAGMQMFPGKGTKKKRGMW